MRGVSSAWSRRGSGWTRGTAGAGTARESSLQDSMKASKESSSQLCPSGDVPPSAARGGVSSVASRVSDPARVSGGSRCSVPPGVLASARSARFARGAALARSAAEGWWRRSSHSVSGVGPLGSAPGRPAANAFRVPLRAAGRHSALAAGPLPRQASPFVSALVSVVGAPAFLPRPPWSPRAAVGSAVQAVRLHRSSVAVPLRCGRPPRAVARVGSPGPWVVERPLGR